MAAFGIVVASVSRTMQRVISNFGEKKFSDNAARDKRNLLALESLGFKVITIWECEIKNDLRNIIDMLRKELIHG